MRQRKFIDLMTHLRFDDKDTRQEKKATDLFAPFRDIWDMFQSNLKIHYTPGAFVVVGEQLVHFRGRCAFIPFLPRKPDKYGCSFSRSLGTQLNTL